MARKQIIVVSERASEVWPVVARGVHVHPPRRAAPFFSGDASTAAATVVEVTEDHTVADGQRLAIRVSRDTFAQGGNLPGALMALVPRLGAVPIAALAKIAVHVRATNVRERHLDQEPTRLGLGGRILTDLEDIRHLVRSLEHHGASGLWHRATSTGYRLATIAQVPES